MRWHTKNTEFTGDEGTTATTLRSSYSCATAAGDGGGVGGKCFRFCLCLQPSNCTSIGNKLNSFFKSSLFCPWWQLTRNVPVFIWTQELFHPPFFPCTLEGEKESTAGWGSGSQPRSTHHRTFKHPTLTIATKYCYSDKNVFERACVRKGNFFLPPLGDLWMYSKDE